MPAREVLVFLAFVAIVIALLSTVFSIGLSAAVIIGVGVGIVVLAAILPRLVEFKEYERGVMFRFGKFRKVAGPGWFFYWPAFESFVPVDLRTTTVDLPQQSVITQDDVEINVDAVIYERVVDAEKAVIQVKDFKGAMRELLRSQIRNTVGKMELEEVLEKTEEMGIELKNALKSVTEDWGVEVFKVELQTIKLPDSLIQAMHKRREAGEYKIKLETEAQAKQISLDIIDKATSKVSPGTLTYLYLDSLKSIANGKATKIVLPVELSNLARALSDKVGVDKHITVTPELAKQLVDKLKK